MPNLGNKFFQAGMILGRLSGLVIQCFKFGEAIVNFAVFVNEGSARDFSGVCGKHLVDRQIFKHRVEATVLVIG